MNIDALPWFHVPSALKNPTLRVFCFSYAGGSAGVFYEWQKFLPEGVEIFSVQLPGRSDRIAEKPLTNLEEIVERLYQVIQPYITDCGYCFFGHSMGARVSYELASLLENDGKEVPKALFVSGALAPNLERKKPNIHHLSDSDFVAELSQLNGTPSEVLENKPLMEFILPTLKADFEVCETWSTRAPRKVNISVIAFCGDADEDVSPEDMRCWQEFTDKSFSLHVLSGDHFFIHSMEAKLLSLVGAYLRDRAMVEASLSS